MGSGWGGLHPSRDRPGTWKYKPQNPADLCSVNCVREVIGGTLGLCFGASLKVGGSRRGGGTVVALPTQAPLVHITSVGREASSANLGPSNTSSGRSLRRTGRPSQALPCPEPAGAGGPAPQSPRDPPHGQEEPAPGAGPHAAGGAGGPPLRVRPAGAAHVWPPGVYVFNGRISGTKQTGEGSKEAQEMGLNFQWVAGTVASIRAASWAVLCQHQGQRCGQRCGQRGVFGRARGTAVFMLVLGG